ncbi:MAG: histidine--tRNA ligase [Leptospiraceae bacterium]|nr:histidine--tRNA ligase [Leptospiraceae bacterium]MDW8306637.1 histidine--tRNA ligase [Leptospiraceae bacterium]
MAEFLSTKPYKGSRDFYPEEMRSREWMFSTMSRVVESFGFERYDAPLIEPLEIYLRKTSEEIVNQQIYSFLDRGERKVAIRPEMTPSVARMVARRFSELVKPLRWYSIPNLWRYEQPSRGRLREHWQLNCDIFGAQDEFLADIEILLLAINLLKAFGANQEHFRLKLSHRQILNQVLYELLSLPPESWLPIGRIIDKKDKITVAEFEDLLQKEGLDREQIKTLFSYLEEKEDFLERHAQWSSAHYLLRILKFLEDMGVRPYIDYDPAIVRGFDYYTGIVFEVYDRHPENRRSLFGGGRYDELTGAFSKEKVNAVGFGMGDVTLEDFLKTHGLWQTFPRKTELFMALFGEEELIVHSQKLAQKLRDHGFCVEMSLNSARLGRQFEEAHRKEIPLVLVIGSEEYKAGLVLVKDLNTGEQRRFSEEELLRYLKERQKNLK